MPSESLPLTVLQEIDRVCDSFEAAWHAGLKPRIEDYLNVTTLEYRTELFGELLAREVELRKKAGESPEAADYAPRFACYGELIQTVINHSGQSGLTVVLPLTSTEDGPDAQPSGGGLLTEPSSTSAKGVTWDPAASGSNAPIVVPDRIGRFRVVRLLGRGNFLVFLAHDDQNEFEVAIKVARTGDPFSQRRLMSLAEEAQRLSALDHPGIVKIHEFVTPPSDAILEQEGGPGGFIVLEYVPGLNLEELFCQSSMAPARLAQIAAEVADAIHHAHTLGLVHRDLKPSNILIDAHGHPRVCDFGLAIDEEIQRLRRGEVAGTLPYMAPEQVRGETNRLDGRTDIWALGVILYRGLTGRPPFRGACTAEYFDEILNREPRPPRQFSNEIPRELERICLRCLSRQMSDRYLTAADLADDLRLWLFEESREPSAATAAPPVLPKGLHSFGSEDAGFFLTLLPGLRGSDGLPESVRFWKSRIEVEERDVAFSIGVIYGPSGGGKSSFVKAGLIPLLDRTRVRPIAVEARPNGTEELLLSELRRVVPQLPRECNLPDAVAMLRDDPHIWPREKLLLVLDQFEQWLQGRPIEPSTELVRALRQCDGRRVQALLLVRDDFWMALTRLLRAVEVPLVEGANGAAVELFDSRHTRKVLEEYGRSLGQLAPGELPAGSEGAVFLDRAVQGLTGPDGRVIPVRLSLFVEVVRNRPWTVHTLRALWGMEGIGVKFLEEAFDSALAAPAHRVHRRAATAVLQLLLPAPTAVLRGSPRSGRELREASGYAEQPGDFADLLQVLDHDLRLITPVDDTGAETGAPAVALDPPHETHYQLAHDYLILPIRQWIDRKQRSTRSGRARRRLQAITAAWLERPGARQLPSVLEYAGILRNTRPGDWSSEERRLMRATTWHLLRRLAVAATLVAAVVIGGKVLMDQIDARTQLNMAFLAGDRDLPAIIDRLVPYQHRVVADLQAREATARLQDHQRDVSRILLYRFAPTPERGHYLHGLLLEATAPSRVRLICAVLAAHPEYAGISELRHELVDADVEPYVRLRDGCALAALDPAGVRELGTAAPIVARALLAEGGRSIPGWLGLLGPAMQSLVDPLSQLCRDPEVHEGLSITAAEALAEILKRRGDAETLAAKLVDSRPEAALILLRELAKLGRPNRAVEFLSAVLDQSVQDLADESEKNHLASRQALAAIALESLDKPDALWTGLRHKPDPRVRALLIDRMAALMFRRQRLAELTFRWEDEKCECLCCCEDLRAASQGIGYHPGALAWHRPEPAVKSESQAPDPDRQNDRSPQSPPAARRRPSPGRILAAFDRRDQHRFRTQFLPTLRDSGNHEPVWAFAYGLFPSELARLEAQPGVTVVAFPHDGVCPALRRLRDFQRVVADWPEDTPVAYWDASDILFQGQLGPLWDMVDAHPDILLITAEPKSYPENPVIRVWSDWILDPSARARAFEIMSTHVFLNSGFAAGTASALLSYLREGDRLLNSPALLGVDDWGDQVALNVYCHSNPGCWKTIEPGWNYTLAGRETDEYRITLDGRAKRLDGGPVHVLHGNDRSLRWLELSPWKHPAPHAATPPHVLGPSFVAKASSLLAGGREVER